MQRNFIIHIGLIFGIILFMPRVSLSQDGVPILLKGTVIDKFTGKPTDVTMSFKDKNGKKFSAVPNILTGKYEQVLVSGNEYEITFINFDVARETETVKIKFTDVYEEIIHNFTIKKLAVNNKIYEEDMFQCGKSDLTDVGENLLNRLNTIFKFNRGVKLQFIISENKSDKSDKSKELIESRINFLKSSEQLKNYLNKITFTNSASISDKNFSVIVNEIKDPLKN